MGGAALGMEIGSTYGGKAGAAMGGAAGPAAVRAEPADAAVHEWRKRSKDLWYHLRLLRDGRREVLAPAADRAHELSDLLGDHHDLAVLAEDVKARRNGLSTASRRSLLTGI